MTTETRTGPGAVAVYVQYIDSVGFCGACGGSLQKSESGKAIADALAVKVQCRGDGSWLALCPACALALADAIEPLKLGLLIEQKRLESKAKKRRK